MIPLKFTTKEFRVYTYLFYRLKKPEVQMQNYSGGKKKQTRNVESRLLSCGN